VTRVRWAQVAAWRARRHRLDARVKPAEMHDVVSRLCGLHAQLTSSAELTLLARVEGLDPSALRDALWKERSLVKLWAMRGTLHMFASDEYPMWQAGLDTFTHFRKPGWLRGFGVTAIELDRLLDAVELALDGHRLTREELAAEVARRRRSKKLGEQVLGSWGSLLKPASYTGKLCFAPDKGRNVAFTGPRKWLRLPRTNETEGDVAVADITRRYLATNAPVTPDDLGRWWGGLGPGPARKRIEALGEEVALVDVEGQPMYVLERDLRGLSKATTVRSVRLLPAFDQYVVAATKHAEELMPGAFASRVYRPQGWLSAVLLVNGRIDGVWKHERKGKRVAVTIEPFSQVTKAARCDAEAEAERVAEFLCGELDLAWV